MYRFTCLLFCILFVCGPASMWAQANAVQDTLSNRMILLTQLSQSGSYEQAEVEAEATRAFMKRHQVPFTPKIVSLLSGIYRANQDDRSATRLLAEAELSARKDPNYVTKATLLKTLVDECRKWDLPDQALTCQQLLATAQDSIDARERRNTTASLRTQLDSLSALRRLDASEQSKFLRIEREQAMLMGAGVGLLFLLLLFGYFRANDRWRKIMEKKELEWDIMRSNLQYEAEMQHNAAVVEATQAAAPITKPVPVSPLDPYTLYQGPKPEAIALLIEPNRQVVLYLKSLLSDRFQVETANTFTEGMQLATELLPDLIVCDALLNGKTGIEVARQIKLSERTNHIPVVLLTDKFGNEGKLDALRAGADAWFTRPVIDDEFDASVQRLLDARKIKHDQFNRFLQLYFSENRVPLDEPFLLTTVQMIEQNLANPDFMADDIARKLQLTKTHYVKKLKVLTGKEPIQLIREMRLEKAKVLLEKRAGTPQAISELVGFSSPGTFALAFKEYFGENTLLLAYNKS
ncbi:MAG: response regulator transcription factor [Saprospiraceae bacterium]|nr:response regulator transcription factor [Saprospiraceae bacterium]